MMGITILASVERWVLAAALVLTVVGGLVWQTPHGIGSTAAGALLAILNLRVLQGTVGGLLNGSVRTQTAMGVVLVLKMGLLLAAIWAAVRLLGLDPVGVALGVSALVVGVVGGALRAPQQPSPDRPQPER